MDTGTTIDCCCWVIVPRCRIKATVNSRYATSIVKVGIVHIVVRRRVCAATDVELAARVIHCGLRIEVDRAGICATGYQYAVRAISTITK